MSLSVESHAKMLSHLAPLRFFRPEHIPERVLYVSGYPALRNDSLEGLLRLIRDTLKGRQPTMPTRRRSSASACPSAWPNWTRPVGG